MNPKLMQMLLPFLAGAGLAHFASSVKKLKDAMGNGAAMPQRPAPSAVQAMMQGQAPAPDGNPSPGGGNLASLAALLASRGMA